MTTAQGSTKLNVLRCMLAAASKLGEKVVIVSTSTQMLDAAAQVCGGLGLPTGRIDGSTPAALRQELVDQFNDTSPATGNLMKVRYMVFTMRSPDHRPQFVTLQFLCAGQSSP